MIRPYRPILDETIKAEHLLSHAKAIEWLRSRLKIDDRKYNVDAQLNANDYGNYTPIDSRIYQFALDLRPISGLKSAIITGGSIGNFTVPSFTIDLSVPLIKLLWVRIDVVVTFRDSYSKIFECRLSSAYQITPGISIGDSYPQGLAPNGVTGIGYHIEPLGRLTVESGEARFEHLGYGSIFVSQFGGTIYGSRDI